VSDAKTSDPLDDVTDTTGSPDEPSMDDENPSLEAELEAADGPARLRSPEYNSRLGALGNAWKQYKHNKKQKRIAGKGYVQWYLIDDGWPEPKYVKPKREGGGVREYEHDGEIYLFPREAFLNDKRTGAWTVVHRKGELDPISLQEPGKHALDADAAKEWAELTVTSEPPGFFEDLSIDSEDAMMYLIMAIVAIAVGQQLFGGGGFL